MANPPMKPVVQHSELKRSEIGEDQYGNVAYRSRFGQLKTLGAQGSSESGGAVAVIPGATGPAGPAATLTLTDRLYARGLL